VWAAVSLLEDLVEEVGHDYQSKIIQAESIVKAAAVTHASTDEDIGAHGFDLSWSLWVAIRLIQEVIDERGKKNKKSRGGPKKSMREISTVDPDCARQFHRLLVTAARLPLEELKRITRYAEIELADGPQRSVKATVDAATKALTAPPEVRP
jgi:hypothetical protein